MGDLEAVAMKGGVGEMGRVGAKKAEVMQGRGGVCNDKGVKMRGAHKRG